MEVQGSKEKGKQREQKLDEAEEEEKVGGQEEKNGIEGMEERSSSFFLVTYSVGNGVL